MSESQTLNPNVTKSGTAAVSQNQTNAETVKFSKFGAQTEIQSNFDSLMCFNVILFWIRSNWPCRSIEECHVGIYLGYSG